MGFNMNSELVQECLDLLSAYMGKLYLEDLTGDREVLEDAAMEAVCACRKSDLADTLHEQSDKTLLSIVTYKAPCGSCGM